MSKLINHRKRGGLHFVTIGRLNISWSIKRKPVAAPLAIEDWQSPLMSAETEAHATAMFAQLRTALE